MYIIRAIYNGTDFRPMQAIPVKEDYEVFITFVEPIRKNMDNIDDSVKLPRSTGMGLWQGKIQMSDDFNEPLEVLTV